MYSMNLTKIIGYSILIPSILSIISCKKKDNQFSGKWAVISEDKTIDKECIQECIEFFEDNKGIMISEKRYFIPFDYEKYSDNYIKIIYQDKSNRGSEHIVSINFIGKNQVQFGDDEKEETLQRLERKTSKLKNKSLIGKWLKIDVNDVVDRDCEYGCLEFLEDNKGIINYGYNMPFSYESYGANYVTVTGENDYEALMYVETDSKNRILLHDTNDHFKYVKSE